MIVEQLEVVRTEIGCLLFSSPEHRVAQTHCQVTETANWGDMYTLYQEYCGCSGGEGSLYFYFGDTLWYKAPVMTRSLYSVLSDQVDL